MHKLAAFTILPESARDCQQCEACSFSGLATPRILYLLRRLCQSLTQEGMAGAYRRTAGVLGIRAARSSRPKTASLALDLQPGELVEVKSEREIQGTLDAGGKHNGLGFLPGMRPYCGRRFRVRKRLERMFLEHSRQIRRLNSTVLLDGVHCDGEGTGCDRLCFYFWREAWLRRVPAEPELPPVSHFER